MRRREFITLLGSAAAWPLAARAQQSNQTRRIGVLMGPWRERSGSTVGDHDVPTSPPRPWVGRRPERQDRLSLGGWQRQPDANIRQRPDYTSTKCHFSRYHPCRHCESWSITSALVTGT